MQNEDICHVHEEGETESGLDPGFGSASDEKLDPRHLLDEPFEHRENSRRCFLVLAFIESIDYDDCRNICRLEWFGYQSLHQANKRLVHDVRIRLKEGDEDGSKCRVFAS